MPVVDLEGARQAGPAAASPLEDAARRIEVRGGCLLCVHVDEENRRHLDRAGSHVAISEVMPPPAVVAPATARED